MIVIFKCQVLSGSGCILWYLAINYRRTVNQPTRFCLFGNDTDFYGLFYVQDHCVYGLIVITSIMFSVFMKSSFFLFIYFGARILKGIHGFCKEAWTVGMKIGPKGRAVEEGMVAIAKVYFL